MLNLWFTRYQTINDVWSLKLVPRRPDGVSPDVHCRSNSISAALAFGRGYGAAEISGDNGIAGSLELRFDQKLEFPIPDRLPALWLRRRRTAWNDGFRPADGLALTSAGGGVRFFLGGDFQADLGVAVPSATVRPTMGAASALPVHIVKRVPALPANAPRRAASRPQHWIRYQL